MAINATIPGGQAFKEGIFPPKVIRREIHLSHPNRLEPMMGAVNRPAPRNPQQNKIYSQGAHINFVV